MKVYHGTAFARAKKIVRDKTICVTSEETTHYLTEGYTKTTYGYVYVTTSINQALGYSIPISGSTRFAKGASVIFEIEVLDSELEEDEDEKFHRANVTQVELPPNTCKRIKRDLIFGQDVKRFVIVVYRDQNHGFELADDEELSNKLESKWVPVS